MSAFKELKLIPQFKATAELGEFLKARFSQSFYSTKRFCHPPLNSNYNKNVRHYEEPRVVGSSACEQIKLLLGQDHPVCRS